MHVFFQICAFFISVINLIVFGRLDKRRMYNTRPNPTIGNSPLETTIKKGLNWQNVCSWEPDLQNKFIKYNWKNFLIPSTWLDCLVDPKPKTQSQITLAFVPILGLRTVWRFEMFLKQVIFCNKKLDQKLKLLKSIGGTKFYKVVMKRRV